MFRDPVETDPIVEHRIAEAAAQREFFRGRYFEEMRVVIRLQKEVDCMALEMDFLRQELGEERWAFLQEKYVALRDAALRQTTGYAYSLRAEEVA